MRKILIIDDEPDLKNILVQNFKSENWDAMGCESAKAALELISSFKPDVIISDITMPTMTGLQMLKVLEGNSSNIPVILLTGYSDFQKIRSAWDAGAFELLDKPFKMNILLEIANNAFQHGTEYVSSARKRFLNVSKLD